jgi:hypothetical protein
LLHLSKVFTTLSSLGVVAGGGGGGGGGGGVALAFGSDDDRGGFVKVLGSSVERGSFMRLLGFPDGVGSGHSFFLFSDVAKRGILSDVATRGNEPSPPRKLHVTQTLSRPCHCQIVRSHLSSIKSDDEGPRFVPSTSGVKLHTRSRQRRSRE